MLYCPLCNENLIFVSSLCHECIEIKRYIQLYDRKTVSNILKNVLKRQSVGIIKKQDIQSAQFKPIKPE